MCSTSGSCDFFKFGEISDNMSETVQDRDMVAMWPRHQGGAHGGRAPAKIVRAPAKITGLIMFHLGCHIKIVVFWGIFGI